MLKLFSQGEPLFMYIISTPLLAMLLLAIPLNGILIKFGLSNEKRFKLIKSIGLFSLILGIFTQFLGLYGALESIEIWGEVEAQMLFQGIRISFIPMVYGTLIFLLSIVISTLGKTKLSMLY